MFRYFVVGNGWLLIALVLSLGKQVMRTEPEMNAFFGIGHWYPPEGYNFLTFLVLVVAVYFFVLYAKTRTQ
jgi:hypothetical protein